jgi:DNA anti-recombination protein RmuC
MRRPGRPPIGKVAMTASERVRRWAERHSETKPETKLADEAEVLALRGEVLALREQLAVVTASSSMLQHFRVQAEELKRLRRQLSQARAVEPGAEALARQVSQLEKELAAARTALERDPGSLQAENDKLRKRVRDLLAQRRARLNSPNNVLFITKASLKRIRAGLHPDNVQEPAAKKRLEVAFQVFESLPIKIIDDDSTTGG